MRLLRKQLYYKQHGFTLVELIVAVAITTIILVGLSSTTTQLIKNSQSNYNQMTAIRNLDAAGLWLVRDFEAASEYPGNTSLTPDNNSLVITQSLFEGDTAYRITSYRFDRI